MCYQIYNKIQKIKIKFQNYKKYKIYNILLKVKKEII